VSRRPTVNSRKVEVIETLFEIPVSLHISELKEPYVLRGAVIRDGNDFRFDLRLFYRRVWKDQSYFTATDKGIRFTRDDLVDLQALIENSGIRTMYLSDLLVGILNDVPEGTAPEMDLSDGYVLKLTRVVPEEGEVYVDFRKYLIHHDTGFPSPSKRGFKLSSDDILRLRLLERGVIGAPINTPIIERVIARLDYCKLAYLDTVSIIDA